MSNFAVSVALTLIDKLSGPLRGVVSSTRGAGSAATAAMQPTAAAAAKVTAGFNQASAAAQKFGRTAKGLSVAADLSIVAQSAERLAGHLRGIGQSGLDAAVKIEEFKGALKAVGVEDVESVAARGREMSRQWAGVTSTQFTEAAYNIKSAISTLSDQGVTDMTASAVLVAKATKGQASQMTDLFGTGYGIYKRQFAALNDSEFSEKFGAGIAAMANVFRSDGASAQRAIESLGASATLAGMQMEEQFAILGSLQGVMSGGEAGTALRSMADKAAQARTKFAEFAREGKNPVKVRIVDSNGMLRSMPDILTDLKKRYGETLDAIEAAEIAEAFGTDEAVRVVKVLWGQEEALRGNIKAMQDATGQGNAYVETMAKSVDDNKASAYIKTKQQFEEMSVTIGTSLLPVVTQLGNAVAPLVQGFSDWATANSGTATSVAAIAAGVTGLIAVSAPLMATFALLKATGGLAAAPLRWGAGKLFGRGKAGKGGAAAGAADAAASAADGLGGLLGGGGAMPVFVTNWQGGGASALSNFAGAAADAASGGSAGTAGPRKPSLLGRMRGFGGKLITGGATAAAAAFTLPSTMLDAAKSLIPTPALAAAPAMAGGGSGLGVAADVASKSGGASDLLGGLTRGAGKFVKPLGTLFDLFNIGTAAAAGDSEGVGGAAGSMVGGWGGAAAGAAAGAALGSVVPILGTALGGIIGGALGGFGGGELGDWLGRKAGAWFGGGGDSAAAKAAHASPDAGQAVSRAFDAPSAGAAEAPKKSWWQRVFGKDETTAAQTAAAAPKPEALSLPTAAPAAGATVEQATTISAPMTLTVNAAYGKDADELMARVKAMVEGLLRSTPPARSRPVDAVLYDR